MSSLSSQNRRLQTRKNNDSPLTQDAWSCPEESNPKIITCGSIDDSLSISQRDDDKYKQLRLENIELKEALRQQQASLRADQVIKREAQLFVPKEKSADLRLAMDSSKDFVLVVFDATGKLKYAKPETSRNELENI